MKKKHNLKDLNVSEIEAMLFDVYDVTVQGAKSKIRKADYVIMLEKEMSKNIAKYNLFLASLNVVGVGVVVATLTSSSTENNEPADYCKDFGAVEIVATKMLDDAIANLDEVSV